MFLYGHARSCATFGGTMHEPAHRLHNALRFYLQLASLHYPESLLCDLNALSPRQYVS